MRLVAVIVIVLVALVMAYYYGYYIRGEEVHQQSQTYAGNSTVFQKFSSCKCENNVKNCTYLIDQYYRTIEELNNVKSKLYQQEMNLNILIKYVAWLNRSHIKISEELKRRVILEEGLKWILNDTYVNSVGKQIYNELKLDNFDSYTNALYKWLTNFTYTDDQPSPLPLVICSRTVVTDGPQPPPPLNGSFCNITLVYVDVNIKPPDWAVVHRQGNCRDLAAVAYVALEYAARAAGLRNAVYFAAVWFNDTTIGHAATFFYYGGLLTIVDPAGKYLTPDGGRPPGQELSAYNAHWGGRIARLTLYRVEGGQLRVVANGTVAEVASALSAVKN